MEELEKIKAWLMTYPGWEGPVLVDHTQAKPENFGLYPTGTEQLHRTEDVLGNVAVRCRSSYILYRVTTGQQDNTRQAAWLLDFQNWVRQQSETGLAPPLGDEPATGQIRAEKGRLHKASQTGTATYGVAITAEYTKVYKADG